MIERTMYLEKLKTWKDKELIKVLTGIRRSGKSTVLEQYRNYLLSIGVVEDRIISINLEDANYNNLLDQNTLHEYIINKINQKEMNYIFLDEIQMVPEFEKCINSLRLRKNIDLYITGSNSHMLSGELATYLTGRYIEIHVLPLSFKEYLSYYGDNDKLEKYQSYIEEGGFPYLINLETREQKRDYLDSIFNTVLMKDVLSRKQIKDTSIMISIIKFLFDNIGAPISIKKIEDTLESYGRKSTNHTIESYIESLLESFILYKASRYDIKGKKLLKTQEKYYLSDLGLRTYLLGRNELKDFGHILENVIFLELKRRGYKIHIGKNDVGSSRENEVDFVVETNNDVVYIQVCLSTRGEGTLERELRALQSIADNHPKYIITLDYDTANFEGIKQINAIDFLIGKTDI